MNERRVLPEFQWDQLPGHQQGAISQLVTSAMSVAPSPFWQVLVVREERGNGIDAACFSGLGQGEALRPTLSIDIDLFTTLSSEASRQRSVHLALANFVIAAKFTPNPGALQEYAGKIREVLRTFRPAGLSGGQSDVMHPDERVERGARAILGDRAAVMGMSPGLSRAGNPQVELQELADRVLVEEAIVLGMARSNGLLAPLTQRSLGDLLAASAGRKSQENLTFVRHVQHVGWMGSDDDRMAYENVLGLALTEANERHALAAASRGRQACRDGLAMEW